MPAAAGIAIAMSVASAASGYMANKAQQDGAVASAEAYARMHNIPYYGPGEQITEKATRFIANKTLNGGMATPISSMAQLRGGPMGDAVSGFSGGGGASYVAPRARAIVSGGDLLAKQETHGFDTGYNKMATGALIKEQTGKANFQDWQNKGYVDALELGGQPQNAGLQLAPQIAGGVMLGYDAWKQAHPPAPAVTPSSPGFIGPPAALASPAGYHWDAATQSYLPGA